MSTVLRASPQMFNAVTDDIRRATEISAERAPDLEGIRQACILNTKKYAPANA